MKTTHKKMVGGLLIGLLIATIGAVAATGQTDDTTDETTDDLTPLEHSFGDTHGLMVGGMFGYNLTDEQSSELEELMTSLREQNATPDEMRSAIQEKLDEFGVLDAQLDNEIARTEERLTILNREKELRDEGYSWNQISSIIEEEFGLENVTGFAMGMRGGRGGPGHEPRGCPKKLAMPEDLVQ
ncbi:MAG: hypothetical protein MUC80_08385 [Candidatus Thermoplasmatota archaeon]|nr:hypothetical protein [Candidatus Thermoplasmatota archaeon]